MKTILILHFILSLSFMINGQPPSRDEQLVKQVILTFQQDFNDGNFKNADMYTADTWVHIHPGGGVLKGREEVLERIRSNHQTWLKGTTMTIENTSIQFVTPDVAIADVLHKITDYTGPSGIKHENERQLISYVFVKRNETWLLIHDQSTIVQKSSTPVR